ncbi:MAG: hypothetical protein J2P55_00240 [Rhizobiales bacterium]|nr:hypothetical protein [Hyphomicrobiales bacterium]
MFDLKRPCATCPFRKTQGHLYALPLARLKEIRRGSAFQCHKTVDYENFDDRRRRQGDRPQQCAGLMAVLARENDTNTIMQIAERLGELNIADLDPQHEAYDTWADVVAAHTKLDDPR